MVGLVAGPEMAEILLTNPLNFPVLIMSTLAPALLAVIDLRALEPRLP
jgi:hypothetical protein